MRTNKLTALAMSVGCFLSVSALADDAAALAKKSGCMTCHAVDKKVVGPAYKDVAKKYKGNPNAVAILVKKVSDGGSGVWGPIPMPPNKPKVSEADIKTLVNWVLSQQ
ncbi:MAG TPA: c-type cytochrome [Terriglobales bacterium]|nr:c-type cytochrome [Terriglobales bacterium]